MTHTYKPIDTETFITKYLSLNLRCGPLTHTIKKKKQTDSDLVDFMTH